MITEDYVSFETAKLLKEKGFDEPCALTEFDLDAYKKWVETAPRPITLDAESEKPFRYSVPSIYVALKWLREVHNQIIVPGIRVDDRTSGIINCYIVGIWYIPKNNGGAFCYTSPTPYNGYPSYEAASEAAIRYCLENLI